MKLEMLQQLSGEELLEANVDNKQQEAEKIAEELHSLTKSIAGYWPRDTKEMLANPDNFINAGQEIVRLARLAKKNGFYTKRKGKK